MSDVMQPPGAVAGEEQSTAGQVGERAKETVQQASTQAQEKVQQAAGQAQEKVREARGQVSERVRTEVDSRSTQAGEQLTSVADAFRRTGETMRDEGNGTPASLAEAVAERTERLGGYLRDADAERILGDVEELARRQPWLLTAGGFVAGLFGSRLLKASSRRRYSASAELPRSTGGPYEERPAAAWVGSDVAQPGGAFAPGSVTAGAEVPLAGDPGPRS